MPTEYVRILANGQPTGIVVTKAALDAACAAYQARNPGFRPGYTVVCVRGEHDRCGARRSCDCACHRA